MVHIFNGKYYSNIKQNETLPFVMVWMDLEGIMLNEISQTEKTKTIRFHLHVESKEQNKWTEQKQTYGLGEQTDGCYMGGGLGVWLKNVKG